MPLKLRSTLRSEYSHPAVWVFAGALGKQAVSFRDKVLEPADISTLRTQIDTFLSVLDRSDGFFGFIEGRFERIVLAGAVFVYRLCFNRINRGQQLLNLRRAAAS